MPAIARKRKKIAESGEHGQPVGLRSKNAPRTRDSYKVQGGMDSHVFQRTVQSIEPSVPGKSCVNLTDETRCS